MSKEAYKTIHGNEYSTDNRIFQTLNKEFDFKWDLACSDENKKCDNGFTILDDSLSQDWHKIKGWLWLNPPYSPLKPWIKKAQHENSLGAKIVVLCPPVLSTRYFKARLASKIRFILGRLPFVLNGELLTASTHDSVLLIYDTEVRQPLISYVERDNLLGKVK